MSADRTHFVYRAFDEFGQLLYVGCTKQPVQRYKQHRAEHKPFITYATRWHVSGPYLRATAFRLEKEAIEAERPAFNALREHKVSQRIREQERNRRVNQLRRDRPELFGTEYNTPAWNACHRLIEQITQAVDAEYPVIDASWRLAQYLNSRRLQVVKPA